MSCRCGADWSGHRAAHCTSCHNTFSSDTGFDKHLKSLVTAGCEDPRAVVHSQESKYAGKPVFRWDDRRKMWKLADHRVDKPWA